MSWGVGLRTGVGISISDVAMFFLRYPQDEKIRGFLLAETGFKLLQENGSSILL